MTMVKPAFRIRRPSLRIRRKSAGERIDSGALGGEPMTTLATTPLECGATGSGTHL